jgi:glutamyl-tRNA synthetase
MNNQYIQRLSDDEFIARITPFLPTGGQEDALRVLAPHLKERVHRLVQVREQLEFLYLDELDLDADLLRKQGNEQLPAAEALRAAEDALRDLSPFSEHSVAEALEAEVGRRELRKKGAFYMPIRVAISGKTKTPPLFPMLAALGEKRSLTRLRDAIDVLAPGVA